MPLDMLSKNRVAQILSEHFVSNPHTMLCKEQLEEKNTFQHPNAIWYLIFFILFYCALLVLFLRYDVHSMSLGQFEIKF